MCRLLFLYNPNGFDPNPHLEAFRELSKNSKEYQGHGWGCAWLNHQGYWDVYRNIKPVWEDDAQPVDHARVFLAHARSAFRDEGICIENNMPFEDGENVFIFNGELRGVKIKAEGRIGAEKIFNYIKRFDRGDLQQAVEKGVDIIEKRTRYIRAMNFFLSNDQAVHLCSVFNEDPDYFQLCETRMDDALVICSQTYWQDRYDWAPIPNRTIKSVRLN